MEFKINKKGSSTIVLFDCANMSEATQIADSVDMSVPVKELRWNGQAKIATIILPKNSNTDKVESILRTY